jgi:hypothetical protein
MAQRMAYTTVVVVAVAEQPPTLTLQPNSKPPTTPHPSHLLPLVMGVVCPGTIMALAMLQGAPQRAVNAAAATGQVTQ